MPKPDISEPAMWPIRPSGPVPETPSGLVLKPKACVQYRTRNVKCDREAPCGNCARWSLDCVFPSPIRKWRPPRKAAAETALREAPTPPAAVRRSAAPDVWALTGLVRRLDCISAWKSSSPFEEEIRRRLRWELWYLDHRAHEDSGRGPAPLEAAGASELPLNVRDIDLDPFPPASPLPGPGWTEISFSLVRFEIARAARTMKLLPSTSQKLAMVDECERTVQYRYLRYCDGSEPVQWLAKHVAHVLLMELRFKLLRKDQPNIPYFVSGPDSKMCPRPAQDRLFLQVIDIVDTPRRIEAEPQAK
ncbi:hypothetical protein VUR80DRAFT_3584 [Thermomyces stellatus]